MHDDLERIGSSYSSKMCSKRNNTVLFFHGSKVKIFTLGGNEVSSSDNPLNWKKLIYLHKKI